MDKKFTSGWLLPDGKIFFSKDEILSKYNISNYTFDMLYDTGVIRVATTEEISSYLQSLSVMKSLDT